LTDEVRQALADLHRGRTAGGISPNASPIDVLNEDDPNSAAKVFMFRGRELPDAAQQVAMTSAPWQSVWVAHAGDIATSLGLAILIVAEAIGKAFS
jgi:hypothetical protein